jgi:hypothetical protein
LSLDSILWLSGFAAEIAVVGLCIKGGQFRTIPVFCSYVAWSLLVDPFIYYSVKFPPNYYLKIYLGQLIVDSIFQFAVLVELGWAVLRPIRSSLPRHSILILAALIGLAAAVIWPLASLVELPKSFGPLFRLFVHVQQTIAILRVVIFMGLAAFSQLLSIGWRNRELQVATGLGFYSMFSLAITLTHSHQAAWHYYKVLDQLAVASYVASLVYWIVSFAQKEVERQEFTPQMRTFLLTVSGAAHGTRVALADSRIAAPRKSGEP